MLSISKLHFCQFPYVSVRPPEVLGSTEKDWESESEEEEEAEGVEVEEDKAEEEVEEVEVMEEVEEVPVEEEMEPASPPAPPLNVEKVS